MSQLLPCPACHRHVESHETSCPFCLVALLAESWSTYDARKLVYLAAVLLLCQTAFCYFIEAITPDPTLPNMQPEPANALTNPRRALAEAHYLFRDRSLAEFLSPQQKNLFRNVGVWIAGEGGSSGLEVSVDPQAPIIANESFVELADLSIKPFVPRMLAPSPNSPEKRVSIQCHEQSLVARNPPLTPKEDRMLSAKIEGRELIIRVPLNPTPVLSSKGKTLLVASSHGGRQTEAKVNGQSVTVNLNAYIAK